MPDLKGIENLYLILAFLVPGLVTTYVRAQFLTGRVRNVADSAVPYLALSVLYYGLSFPAVEAVLSVHEPGWSKGAAWIALIFLGPALFGFLLGLAAAGDWVRRLAARIGLNPVHPAPTAWDYVFAGRRGDAFVLVTLENGSMIAGLFGADSFASSDPAERDLLIEEVHDVDDEGRWTERPERVAILVPAKQIKHVEIWRTSGGER